AMSRCEKGVDPGRISFESAPHLHRQKRNLRLRSVIEAEDTHLPVGRERLGPKYLGEPSRTIAALQLHLEQPVLGMHKADTERGVFVVLRDDQRDAIGITLDADFRF